MTCNCIALIERELAAHNTRLALSFTLQGMKAYPMILTELIEKKRGAKPMKIMPSYCPWCGVKYEQTEEADSK